MRADRADARDGRHHQRTVPSRRRISLIAPITSLSCHSHPESANALFSTLGVRVQTGGTVAGSARPPLPAARQTGRVTPAPGGQRAIRPVLGDQFCQALDSADRGRLRPPVALLDVELHPLAFFQAAVPIRLDGGEVDEHVPTTVDRDEAVALVRVEPFDGALSHQLNSLTVLGPSGPALATPEPADRDTAKRAGQARLAPFVVPAATGHDFTPYSVPDDQLLPEFAHAGEGEIPGRPGARARQGVTAA